MKSLTIDRTDLIYELTKEHICYLSLPNVYKKSLLINILETYFSGEKEFFEGLEIYKLEKYWDKYPIFKVDFSVGNYSKQKELEQKLERLVWGWEEKYGKSKYAKNISDRFQYVLEAAYQKTGKKVVIFVNECDKPFLDALDEEIGTINRNILKGLFGTFKAADAVLKFVLITENTETFTELNQFNNISTHRKYNDLWEIIK